MRPPRANLLGQLADQHIGLVIIGDGDDDIVGNVGADTLYGGGGNDTLAGGSGADELYGGQEDDILRLRADDFGQGDGGQDEFVLSAFTGAGTATIGDFNGSNDSLTVEYDATDPSAPSLALDGTGTDWVLEVTYADGTIVDILFDNAPTTGSAPIAIGDVTLSPITV